MQPPSLAPQCSSVIKRWMGAPSCRKPRRIFSIMAERKILVVFGATGNQGGSVIKSILSDPKTASEFKIRGITRDPSKPNARALTAKGVECVAADINSKDQIKSALQGAYAVFAVTNYWDKMDAELEKTQGRNVADLAKVEAFRHYGVGRY